MKQILLLFLCGGMLTLQGQEKGASIIKKVDENMASTSRVLESTMIIHGRRKSRTVSSKGYAEGQEKSFTEYLSPAREKGTKMLKLHDRLWIYSPATDRIIQLSGHMLRQSVMGSDLSYEDMMEDRKLMDIYEVQLIGEDLLEDRPVWVLELNAKVMDVPYVKRKMWIDKERFVPLKENLFAKSGQLLKQVTMSDITQIDNRWFPKKMNYKDMLKEGKGTDFVISNIAFDTPIPEHLFNKAVLKN